MLEVFQPVEAVAFATWEMTAADAIGPVDSEQEGNSQKGALNFGEGNIVG